MPRVIDLEISLPKSEADPAIQTVTNGRPGTPFPGSLPRPSGYGFDNYAHVFRQASNRKPVGDAPPDDGGTKKLVEDMDRAGIRAGLLVGARNDQIGQIHRDHPNRFFTLVTIDPRKAQAVFGSRHCIPAFRPTTSATTRYMPSAWSSMYRCESIRR